MCRRWIRNVYAYTGNGPLNGTDPTGLCFICDIAGDILNGIGDFFGGIGGRDGASYSGPSTQDWTIGGRPYTVTITDGDPPPAPPPVNLTAPAPDTTFGSPMGTIQNYGIPEGGAINGCGVICMMQVTDPLLALGKIGLAKIGVGVTAAISSEGATRGIGTAADFGIPRSLSPRQNLHIAPVSDGRSVLASNPSALLQGLHDGAYTILRQPKPGQVVVDFGQTIGKYWRYGAIVGPTQFGSVYFGKSGAHIVPTNPSQW